MADKLHFGLGDGWSTSRSLQILQLITLKRTEARHTPVQCKARGGLTCKRLGLATEPSSFHHYRERITKPRFETRAKINKT